MKNRRGRLEPSALQLVEEAVHLLRGAPASALLVYYAGAVPFVLGLLFFWAHTTWFRPSETEIAWGALGLVALFVALKVLQAEFCARLLALRLGAPPPAWSWARFRRLAITQVRLQSWTFFALFVALAVTVPVGWVYAYAQNLTVLGDEERLHHEAVAQAKLWPGQNHLALTILGVVALTTWLNLAFSFFLVPWLANRLLGIENMFGFSGFWWMNSTFLASVTALTWLAVDPVVKAFYVLRVFHGRARSTGNDLRVDLQLVRKKTGAARIAAAALLLLGMLALPTSPARAAEPARPTAAGVEPAQLDRAIERVLQEPEFRWRLPRDAQKEKKTDEGAIKRFVRQGMEIVKEIGRSIGRAVKSIVDWFERHLRNDSGGQKKQSAATSGSSSGALLQVLLYALIGGAVILILWVIWLMIRSARRNAAPLLAARAVTAAVPDLRDEQVQAAQLPADGWLALAREQLSRGEWRLALRALYLATLARLAADGLVSLAKFKTNLDYEREVRRRALSRAEIAVGFARRRREFEDVWYGHAQAAEPGVRAWLAEMERPEAR